MITEDGLTAAQTEFFAQNGYLVLPNFVDDSECLKLRDQAMILAKKILSDATRSNRVHRRRHRRARFG